MSAPTPANDRIVWIDCEMTGLDLIRDALIEVAAIVTDSELNVLDEGIDVVITPPDEALEQMDPFVREMHTTSKLLDVLDGGMSLTDAQDMVLEYIRQWVPEPRKAPLAGNSIGTDKAFLERDMRQLVAHLHYRVIDVSSIKELARRWYPRIYYASPEKAGGHRALADICESIDELRYYRAAMMVPQPGPDSAQARQIATQVMANSVTGPRDAATGAAKAPDAPEPSGDSGVADGT